MTRQQRIQAYLLQTLTPLYLEVQNESHHHQVPEGSESHFKITVVSDQFEGKTRIMRHRWLNELLAAEFKLGLHALSMHLYTPENWAIQQGKIPNSPDCQHREK